jgi:hypothetical protein
MSDTNGHGTRHHRLFLLAFDSRANKTFFKHLSNGWLFQPDALVKSTRQGLAGDVRSQLRPSTLQSPIRVFLVFPGDWLLNPRLISKASSFF